MPQLVVVREQLDLDALTASLLTSRAGAARRAAAAAEIRRANPTLDLSRLAPGTVVVVPEVEGLRRDLTTAAADDAADDAPAAAADHLVEQVSAGVAALLEEGKLAQARAERERDETRRLLDGPDVDRLRGVAGLAETVDSLRGRLEEEQEESRRTQEVLEASAAAWARELEELRRLL